MAFYLFISKTIIDTLLLCIVFISVSIFMLLTFSIFSLVLFHWPYLRIFVLLRTIKILLKLFCFLFYLTLPFILFSVFFFTGWANKMLTLFESLLFPK